jgi:hypothetical protein
LFIEEAKKWRGIFESASRHAIDKIDGGEKRFIPKTNWERRMSEQSNARFNNMSMLAFGNAILGGSMWT